MCRHARWNANWHGMNDGVGPAFKKIIFKKLLSNHNKNVIFLLGRGNPYVFFKFPKFGVRGCKLVVVSVDGIPN